MDSSGICKGVIVAALGAALGTALITLGSWLFGFHHAAWHVVVAVAGWLWGAATFVVPVPVVVLLIAACVLIYTLQRRRAQPPAFAIKVPPETSARDSLSENENLVIRLLATADGQWLYFEDIARNIKLSKLMTEQALERLYRRNFILDTNSPLYGVSYRLSSRGRDFAIAEGYVP